MSRNLKHIDYKDVETLKKFLDGHSRIVPKHRAGIRARNQRRVARAVKRARYMGLLPYISK